MKIFGNCLIKNEEDIIEETLLRASGWCDKIFVFDNGSTDATWDKVQALARAHPQIVPFKSSSVPYRDSLRAETFNRFRGEANPGDWWCKVDSDEIFQDDPREFLAAVPLRHHVVWGVNFQFYFTEKDVEHFTRNPELYPPRGSAESVLRFYRCDWSEVRFFRHRPRLRWETGSAPLHLGVVHPRRIRFKHYQYRSPAQIQMRLATRQQAIAEGCGTFGGYCEEKDWREKVVDSSTCLEIGTARDFEINEPTLPKHLEPPVKRWAKLLLHGVGIWP